MKKFVASGALALALVLGTAFCFAGCGETGGAESGHAESVTVPYPVTADAVAQEAEDLTIREIEQFLKDKNEHYPLSDEFIERYQQTSGGYLDYAKQLKMEVNKEKHLPNQKWHFFDSWLYRSIEDNSLSWEDSAKRRVYTNLLCPELLLWIYEACGVPPEKVKQAKEVAEQGKAAGLAVTSIAANMRKCVLWEDLYNAVTRQEVLPTGLSAATDTITLFTGSTSNLNDTVPLQFEPQNTTDKRVIWSCGESDVISLDGALLTAEKAGHATVTATSVANGSLSATVGVTVKDPEFYSVSVLQGEGFSVTGLQERYAEQSEVTFTVNVTDSGKEVKEVCVNDVAIPPLTGTVYKFTMPAQNVTIKVTLQDIPDFTSAAFDVRYDLGTGSRAKAITSAEELRQVFVAASPAADIISAVDIVGNLYGGGNGGTGDTAWHSGDMLKLGTTSVTGGINFTLNVTVNRVIITGYVHKSNCKIRVGDSGSAYWTDKTDDGKTAAATCSSMTVADKETVSAGQPSSITLDFQSTKNVTIATVNAVPLYITSIEFIYNR